MEVNQPPGAHQTITVLPSVMFYLFVSQCKTLLRITCKSLISWVSLDALYVRALFRHQRFPILFLLL
jgi:hypothetical protein